MRFTPFLLAIGCVLTLRAQVIPFSDGAGWTFNGPLEYTAFGWSMTTAGDVNGDGYEDMIVSAIDYSNPIATEEEEGRLYLFYGGPDGLSTTPAWTYESDQTLTVLGFSTSGGDVNGDGYSDIVAGGLQWTGDATDEGKVFLWYGGPDGPVSGDADWTLTMGQEAALFGSGAAMDGDLNGDGYDDLFVSAKMWDEPEPEEGKVWLYWGSAAGPVFSGWSWQPDQEGAIAGFPINYAGDVNGDGFDDVVIGVNGYDLIQQDDGMIALFYGGEGLPSLTPDWTASGGQKKCNFGHWTDGAGDVNGDGYDDIIASALLYESELAEGSEGRVFVFHGGPDGPSATADWFGEVNQLQAQLGYSCAGAGDINNDGYDDVIGGAKYWDDGNQDEGGAFVWFGGPDGLETNYCWDAGGDQDSAYYGRHVGGACDFNNDGFADFLVGAYRYTEILEADGKGFVYYGGYRPSDFHLPDDHFCAYAANPIPIIDGAADGIFTSADAIVDPATGEINVLATGAGNFSITYTAPLQCPVTHQFTIEDPSVTDWFGYTSDTFCIDYATVTPWIAPGGSGTFSSDSVLIDSVSGEIFPDSTMIGTHVIYFSGVTATGCNFSDSTVITFLPVTEISFAQDIFCNEQLFTTAIVNNGGGIFSSNDILLDANTGETDLFNSPSGGPYTVTYIANEFCPAATTTLSIDSADHSLAAFVYPSDSICNNIFGILAEPPVLAGGIYSCAGAYVSPDLGFFESYNVTPGVYTIVYTVPNGACTLTDSTTVTVLEGKESYFNYDSIFFLGDPPVTPTVIETGGVFSASSPGLIIDTLTGEIDLILSDTGAYYITYTQPDSLCASTWTDTVFIYPACLSVTDVTISDITTNSFVVTWVPVPYYSDYIVQLEKPGAITEEFYCTCTTYSVTALDPDTLYTIRVLTDCPDDVTSASEAVDVRTEKEVSIHSISNLQARVYPNPAQDMVTLQISQPIHGTISLHDMSGKTMLDQTVSGVQNISLPLDNIAAGVYWIMADDALLGRAMVAVVVGEW